MKLIKKPNYLLIKFTLDFHAIVSILISNRYDVCRYENTRNRVFLSSKQAITFIIRRSFMTDKNKAFSCKLEAKLNQTFSFTQLEL